MEFGWVSRVAARDAGVIVEGRGRGWVDGGIDVGDVTGGKG